jgi:hypothetical protein
LIFAVSTLILLDVTWLDFGLCTYISGKSALEEEGRHVGLPWHCRTCAAASRRHSFLADEAGVTTDACCDLDALVARLIDDAIYANSKYAHDVSMHDTRSVHSMLPVRVPAEMAVAGTGTGTCPGLTHWGARLVSRAVVGVRSRGRGRSPTWYLGLTLLSRLHRVLLCTCSISKQQT